MTTNEHVEASCVKYTLYGEVAVVQLDRPPVNSFGLPLRRGLAAALNDAQAAPEVKAIVLIGNPKAFSAGADIHEFATGVVYTQPDLPLLVQMLDECEKPVVAAISGICLGGGFEIALACHYRVAVSGAQLGLPEVKIGVLPGAGGTQRLPRILGVEAALNMIVCGDPGRSEDFKDTPLFDAFIEGDLLDGALDFARRLNVEATPLPRLRDRTIDYPSHEGFFQFARNTVKARTPHLPAPILCVDCVAAAVTMPFDAGIAFEHEGFEELVRTDVSKALRHAFFAQRAAGKLADVSADTPTRPIHYAAVIGAGTMGSGIAMNFVNAGIPVTLLETSAEQLDRGVQTIRSNYEASARKGKLTHAEVDARMALIRPTLSYADLAGADIVIEAVFEDMAVKERVFRQLDEVMKPGAILASNTSTLDLDQIAMFTRRPEDVAGLHFFSPAHVMKLLEIVRGAKTSREVMATVLALARKLRKTSVVSGVCYGFIGNRMIEQYHRQAIAMLEEGALPRQIDHALENWGMAMGVFRMSDLAGNDVGAYVRKSRLSVQPELASVFRLADILCEHGRLGQKAGKGWYRYEPGTRNPLPDPEVERLIIERSAELGIQRRQISDEEIVQRCVLALTNVGAALLDEGIAQRASDIDLVYLAGYGFPAHRGGPMFYADQLGLPSVERIMRRLAENPHAGGETAWTPAPLASRLAAQGKTFN